MATPAKPSLWERKVLQSALEAVDYGTEGTPYVTVPVFDVGALVEPRINFLEINRAKDSLSADGACPQRALHAFGFKTYTFGNGTSTPPDYMNQFFRACGFVQAQITGAPPDLTGYTAADGVAGAIPIGTYIYTASKVTAATGVETEADVVTGISHVADGSKKADLTLAAAGAGVFWRIYRTKVGVALSATSAFFVGDSAINASTYTDNLLDSELDQTRVAPSTASTVESVVWMPFNEPPTPSATLASSISLKGYLDSHYRTALGARGTFTQTFEAGNLEENNFEFQGFYAAATGGANIAGAANPGCAPPAVSCGFQIVPRYNSAGSGSTTAGTAISPMIVKRVSFTPGTQVAERTDANSGNSGLLELSIHQRFRGELTAVVEVDKAFDWDPVADANNAILFGIKYSVGPSTATFRRLERSFPAAQIIAAPTLINENNGIQCWSLRFGLTDLYASEVTLDVSDWCRMRYY